MAQRVATKRVAAEQDDVDRQDQCADPYSEGSFPGRGINEPERFPNIVKEHEDEKQREIKKITMHVLHDEREGALAKISAARFPDGAGRWIGPESLVVGATVIVTGEPKTARRPEDEKRRRKEEPGGPPKRFRAKPTVRRSAKKLRRIKRRKVGAEIIIFSLERRPGRINDKGAQAEKNNQWLCPPGIGAHRLAKRAARKGQFGLRHRVELVGRSVR